jgi:hypothetical protein
VVVVVAYLKYYAGVHLEELREVTKTSVSWPPAQYLNERLPEYESAVLVFRA